MLWSQPVQVWTCESGAGIPEDFLDKNHTQSINTASQRITGLPINPRIKSLHFIAGAGSIHNIFARRCTLPEHGALISQGNSVRSRLRRELCAMYRIPELIPTVTPMLTGRDNLSPQHDSFPGR